jgi:hypothetical protein
MKTSLTLEMPKVAVSISLFGIHPQDQLFALFQFPSTGADFHKPLAAFAGKIVVTRANTDA